MSEQVANKVLVVIKHREIEGTATAVLAIRDDENPDDVFIRWLQQEDEFYEDASREECLESLYAWNVYEVSR